MSATRVAIVGAGFSGTAAALHLARRGVGVTLIERERVPGRGTAYGTVRPEHLLNVTARRMVVWPDDPLEFARWVETRGGTAADYAQRRHFGDYLSGLLAQAGDRVEIVAGEATAVVRRDGRERVALAGGPEVAADFVILAQGNLRPAPVPGIDGAALGPVWVGDPWFGGFADGLTADDEILLVGTGLTAVDTALTLDAAGFDGRILALSRRGLMPRPHLPREAVAEPARDPPRNAVALLAQVRARARAIGWREAVHELRNVTQDLWAEAPLTERRRFLRHLRAWWDVHRHRIAPAIAARLADMEAAGRLRVAAGRIRDIARDGDRAVVTWRPRGGDADAQARVRRIVNCTGPELDIARAGEPLLSSLLAAGRIRPDICRLGIDVDPACRALDADGKPSPTLTAIGPMTRGAFWESIAVADIAVQADRVAARIAGPAAGP